MCTEVQDYKAAFHGVYVGHDEPSVLYYSNVPGAGNRNQWQVTLPKDPPPSVKRGRSWTFQLTPTLNPTCTGKILGGTEYVNFAFVTHSGRPIGPPNPLRFNPLTSGDPTRPNVLFMRPGDHISVNMHDTPQGLQTVLVDRSTGQTGSMTASAANGFGQIKYAPGRHVLHRDPLQLPPDVLNLLAADPGHLGRALLQRRVR